MITEDYCSYEVAKLLKEKGFDEKVSTHYLVHPSGFSEFFDKKDEFPEPEDVWLKCPTHQMAMKWLREKGFHINAPISYDYSVDSDGNIVDKWTFWTFEILSSFSGELIYTEEVNEYYSYEEAVEAALKYCLENLI